MKRTTYFLIYTLFFALVKPSYTFAHTQWQKLLPGLDYSKLTPGKINPWGSVHVFRIDPDLFSFNLALAKDYQVPASNVAQLAKKTNALLTINGGFFTPQLQPLGLRVNNNEILNPLKKISWLGVFYLQQNKPSIVAQNQFQYHHHINFAIQGGPRLIVDGQIPLLKPGFAERTAIGITHAHQVIIVITENTPLTTTQLAEIMLKSEENDGLACQEALNLDGGHSTQLYAQIGDFVLDIPGFSAITDAIYIKPIKT